MSQLTEQDLHAILRPPPPAPDHLKAADVLAQTAHWYRGAGLPIFPLKPDTKVPATPRGFKDATTDAEQVAKWWNANPRYNIGTPTGAPWWDVIDIDGPEGESAAYRALNVLWAPQALTCTPRGWHLFLHPIGLRNAAHATGPLAGLDVRGTGGYVVLPPSRHPDGGIYQWGLPPARCRACDRLLLPDQVETGATTHEKCETA